MHAFAPDALSEINGAEAGSDFRLVRAGQAIHIGVSNQQSSNTWDEGMEMVGWNGNLIDSIFMYITDFVSKNIT